MSAARIAASRRSTRTSAIRNRLHSTSFRPSLWSATRGVYRGSAKVRFGSKAERLKASTFRPLHLESGHAPVRSARPLSAKSGCEQTQQNPHLLDHLVGAGEQRGGYVDAERQRSDQADDQIESCWLLDRQITWSGPAQNLVNIVTSAPEEVREVRSIRDKTTRFDVFATAVHSRQSRRRSQDVDPNPVGEYERLGTDVKCIRAAF